MKRALAACALVAAIAWLGVRLGQPDADLRSEAEEPAEAALLARLRALGYVDWAQIPPDEAGKSGITLDLPERSWPGFVFYHSRSRSRAHLIAPPGELLHSWVGERTPGGWHHAELLEDGDLLVIRRDGMVERLDLRSRVRWRQPLAAHHDLAVHRSGRIFVLSHGLAEVPFGDRAVPLVEDRIVELTAQGDVVRTLPLHPLFGAAIPAQRMAEIASRPADAWLRDERPLHGVLDVFHTNTIALLDRDVAGLGEAGDLLLCLREIDTVAVVSPRGGHVVWQWGPGELDRPHQPTLLPNGHLLVFDNGASRGWSRIVEVDPVSRRVVWEYRADPPDAFFSEKMGGVQGLANGNVLVTESQRGRAFEVTREGEVVFEFWNPELHVSGSRRASIHRLRKLSAEAVAPVLLGIGQGG